VSQMALDELQPTKILIHFESNSQNE